MIILFIQSISAAEGPSPDRPSSDHHQLSESHTRPLGSSAFPSMYDYGWAIDTDDDEPIDETSSDHVDQESTTSNFDFIRPYPAERVDDRDVELVAAIEEIDQETQNTTFAAAIRWALRTRDLDGVGGNEGTGGAAEEMDETDDIDRLDAIGDRVNHNMLRARELVTGADRRIRVAESQLRGASEGVEIGIGVGTIARAGSDRHALRKDKGGHKEKHSVDKQPYIAHPILPLGTVLEPDKHPRDFIAAVVVDAVLCLATSVLDDYALECFHTCLLSRGISSQSKRDFRAANPLQSLALSLIRTVLKSPYRALLVPRVFRTMLAHCGLRVKWAVADALKRYKPTLVVYLQ